MNSLKLILLAIVAFRSLFKRSQLILNYSTNYFLTLFACTHVHLAYYLSFRPYYGLIIHEVPVRQQTTSILILKPINNCEKFTILPGNTNCNGPSLLAMYYTHPTKKYFNGPAQRALLCACRGYFIQNGRKAARLYIFISPLIL